MVTKDANELLSALDRLEGNLTGCVYSATGGGDDDLYARLAAAIAAESGATIERQDADGSGGVAGDESWRAVSGDGASRIYGGRNSGGAPPFWAAGLLRQCPAGQVASVTQRSESNREDLAIGGWDLDDGGCWGRLKVVLIAFFLHRAWQAKRLSGSAVNPSDCDGGVEFAGCGRSVSRPESHSHCQSRFSGRGIGYDWRVVFGAIFRSLCERLCRSIRQRLKRTLIRAR